MSLLVHTDFGHDPDDCFALAFLLENHFPPKAISITPGFEKQRNILMGFIEQFSSNYFGLDIDYYKSEREIAQEKEKNFNPGKHSIFDTAWFRYVFFPFTDTEIFDKALIIGPAKNLGDELKCNEMYFQGGYSPNSIKLLEKFKGLEAVPSFNPNGAKEDFNKLLNSDTIKVKYYIGKNVCHGFTKQFLQQIWEPETANVKTLWDQMSQSKAMHDVLAAMLCINKDFGIWSQEKPKWIGNKLTTEPTQEEIYTLIGLNI